MFAPVRILQVLSRPRATQKTNPAAAPGGGLAIVQAERLRIEGDKSRHIYQQILSPDFFSPLAFNLFRMFLVRLVWATQIPAFPTLAWHSCHLHRGGSSLPVDRYF